MWSRYGRSGERLLRGEARSQAQAWLSGKPARAPEPTELQLDLIVQSEAAEAAARLTERRRVEELELALATAATAEAARGAAANPCSGVH